MTEPVVLPNSFLGGVSGMEIQTINGLPRINCNSGGNFQVGAGTASAPVFGVTTTVNTFSSNGGTNPRPVTADGFDILGWTWPPVILPPGSSWPPSWWPTQVTPPPAFAPGIPTTPPSWAIGPGAPGPQPPPWNGTDDENTYITNCVTSLTGQGIEQSQAEQMCQAAWDEAQGSTRMARTSATPTTHHEPPQPRRTPPRPSRR
jgi:hypothetical protein